MARFRPSKTKDLAAHNIAQQCCNLVFAFARNTVFQHRFECCLNVEALTPLLHRDRA